MDFPRSICLSGETWERVLGRERGSVLYLGMERLPALQRDSRSLDHHCNTFKRTFEYAGGEKEMGLKGHFCLLFFFLLSHN